MSTVEIAWSKDLVIPIDPDGKRIYQLNFSKFLPQGVTMQSLVPDVVSGITVELVTHDGVTARIMARDAQIPAGSTAYIYAVRFHVVFSDTQEDDWTIRWRAEEK